MDTSGQRYVVPLGVAAALTDFSHANSYLAVAQQGRYWLVDCADNPIGRLQRAGLDPLQVQGIIITHFHPDHVYGLPAFLLGLFLLEREQHRLVSASPLPIYARPEVLESVQALVGLFAAQSWLADLPLTFHPVSPEVGALVAAHPDFTITAAPTQHSVPSLAVRFAGAEDGRALVYSSDTMPCPAVETLARGAALLIHEATGSGHGHSTAAEAGALAARVAVAKLLLMHYPQAESMASLQSAQATFTGPTALAEELSHYAW